MVYGMLIGSLIFFVVFFATAKPLFLLVAALLLVGALMVKP